MIFTPFCLSEATSSYEYELVNLMDSSTVSNKTQITTDIPAMSFSSDKKSINYQGEIFIFNCPMSVNDDDFFTQVIHWLEQDTSTNIVNGKEYISSENGKKIHLFEVERPLKERYEIGGEFRNFNVKSARTWVAIGLIGLKVATAYKYIRGSTILRQLAGYKGPGVSDGEYKSTAKKYLKEMYPNLESLSQDELNKLVDELTTLAENDGGFIENLKSLYSPLQAMNKIKTALKNAAKSKKANLEKIAEKQGGDPMVTQMKVYQSGREYLTAQDEEKVYDELDFIFESEYEGGGEGELKDEGMNFLMQLLDYLKNLLPK